MIEDLLGRPLGSLRISVTDRCNMRCRYCMPNEDYVWLPRSSILTFEEIDRLAGIFGPLGARRIRLTGGEPLLRHDLPALVEALAAHSWLDDLAMTTNGLLLAQHAVALRDAGLQRVTVSIDTLDPVRMEAFARSRQHEQVLTGIEAALDAGFRAVKLNAVVVRGHNDDEVGPLLRYAIDKGVEIRFIEYMDVGGASEWNAGAVVSRADILAGIEAEFGRAEPVVRDGGASAPPADRYRLADGTVFGIIASTTAPFCRTCDRSRITADGTWYHCLYADRGVQLREVLRSGVDDVGLRTVIEREWRARRDRGAEERAATPARAALHSLEGLRADPRREMHTRGG